MRLRDNERFFVRCNGFTSSKSRFSPAAADGKCLVSAAAEWSGDALNIIRFTRGL